MGKTVSKVEKEEVIIAQTGANNKANASQAIAYGEEISYFTIATGVMIAIILFYLEWKKIHKCLTKKIERQAAAVAMRRRASV